MSATQSTQSQFDSTDAPEAPVWMDAEQASAWQSGYAAAVNDMRKAAQPQRETFPAPVKWGHIELPQGAVMIRRFDAQVGDRLVSSHYGSATVTEVLRHSDNPQHVVELRFEGHGEVMTNLVPINPSRTVTRNERYDGDSLIPLLSEA